ncbi:ATP-binding protein [Amycolatopsis cihanbeyliensis]|uniref:Regulatory LuxR family protein n=1 Tax=Amycolatopsis cihanbeyliensis TaxID=1128664 RepID=A0A542DGN4_AMYCI|nr:AAA family ATPase [Amycolatopsis cihanbeyliensis]TQJ02247.1 regulatory LuxR family protein [Amycolatopsis cihanbeyliensis]
MTYAVRAGGTGTVSHPPVLTTSPVLVDRSVELHTLLAVVTSPASVAFVEGEAGVGKTRLVGELLAQPELAVFRPLVGHCQQLREPFPYGAVLDALRKAGTGAVDPATLSPVAGSLRPYLPELAEVLPCQPERLVDARAERHRLFRAARELLGALGDVLLIIEDLHWADDGSRQLLRFLLADQPRSLRLLLTYRLEEAPGGIPLGAAHRPACDGTSATVRVRALDVDGVRRLASAILTEAEVTPAFAGKLHERTAGIPFVVEETLGALRDPRGAVRADGATAQKLLDAVEVPSLLREAMLERLGGLPLVTRRLVQAAAVLGSPARGELIAEVAGVPEHRLRAALADARAANVLLEVGEFEYGFRHALAQQAVYRTLTAPDRVRLHQRAVDALGTVEPAPLLQLAEHARKAGRRADWLRHAEAAADRASGAGDATTATATLRVLLAESTLTPADADRLAHKFSQVAFAGLAQHEVSAALEKLLGDERLSHPVRGEVRLSLGLLLIRQADSLEAARVELALAAAELRERPALRAKAMAVLAQPYVGTTPLAEHLPWMAEVDRITEQSADRTMVTGLLANTVSSRLMTGDPTAWEQVERLPAEVESTEEQSQLARVYCNLADACSWIGYHEHAGRHLRRGTRLAADCGSPFVVSTARSTQAHVDLLTGRWPGLTERAERLLEEYREILPVASELHLVLGSLAAAKGEWDRAAQHFAETGIEHPENAFTPVVLAAHAGMITMLTAREEHAAALAEVDRALRVLRRKAVWAWCGELLPAAVDACCHAGEPARALALTDELDAASAELDAPILQAGLALCRGILATDRGAQTEAAELFDAARAHYTALPAPYLAALATERLAACRLDLGARQDAEEFARLAETFDTLGATRDAARCRHLLRAKGATQPSRRGRRGYGDELSPRERDVANLLTDGRTNREIAEVLFLSRRTVEQHVSSVLRKLKVGSRAELLQRQH